VDLRNVRQQNQDLQKTIDRLRLEQAALLEDAKQGQRLQAWPIFSRSTYTRPLQPRPSVQRQRAIHVFYIDKGSADGLSLDDAVITPDGIVGKVREVFPRTAQVLAVTTRPAARSNSRTTRIRGILRGNAAGGLKLWIFWPTSAFKRAK